MAKRSKTGSRTDTAKLKRKLIALKGRDTLGLDRIAMTQRSRLFAARRAAGKKLAPLFKGAVDLKKAGQILAQAHGERQKIARKRPPDLGKAYALLDQRSRAGMANRRKALEVLSTPGLPFTPTYIAVKPFMIWAKPSNMLYDSSITPQQSNAKIYFYTSSDGSYKRVEVTFYYLWSNPSAYYAVVNAACSVMLKGNCLAEANTGIFDGGMTSVNCSAVLQPLEWWNQPPTYPAYDLDARKYLFSLLADGGGFWSGETGDVDQKMVFDGTDLRYDLFSIPPAGAAVFEVTLAFDYSIDDGEVLIDFANFLNYGITIPYLQIELLTAPMGTASAGALVMG